MISATARGLQEEQVATLIDPKLRTRHGNRDGLGVLGAGSRIEPTCSHQRRTPDPSQPIERVVVATSLELERFAELLLEGALPVAPRRHVVGQTSISVMVGKPLVVESRVEDGHLGPTTDVWRHRGELMEWVARSPCPAG